MNISNRFGAFIDKINPLKKYSSQIAAPIVLDNFRKIVYLDSFGLFAITSSAKDILIDLKLNISQIINSILIKKQYNKTCILNLIPSVKNRRDGNIYGR